MGLIKPTNTETLTAKTYNMWLNKANTANAFEITSNADTETGSYLIQQNGSESILRRTVLGGAKIDADTEETVTINLSQLIGFSSCGIFKVIRCDGVGIKVFDTSGNEIIGTTDSNGNGDIENPYYILISGDTQYLTISFKIKYINGIDRTSAISSDDFIFSFSLLPITHYLSIKGVE